MHFCLFLLLTLNPLIFSSPIYSNDINYLQSQQISIYNSPNFIQSTLTSTISFLQSFNNTPQVSLGIVEFNINILANSADFNFVQNGITVSSCSLTVTANSQTQIYSISICIVAITIPGVIIVSYNYPTNPSESNINNIVIPFSSLVYQLMGYYFTGIAFTATSIVGFELNKAVDIVSNNHSLLIMPNPTTTIDSINIQFFLITKAEISSLHFLSTCGFLQMDLYNTPAPISNSLTAGQGNGLISTFYGLNEFSFDLINKNLLINCTLLEEQIDLDLSVADTTFIQLFFINFAMGHCSPGQTITYTPELYCCSGKCMTCSNTSKCSSCNLLQHRYLKITDTSSGDCLCQVGFVQINELCVACDSSCSQCSIIPTNCTVIAQPPTLPQIPTPPSPPPQPQPQPQTQTCPSGYVFFSNKCIQFCIINYFLGYNNCSNCPPGCQTCQNSTACITFKCNQSIFYNYKCVQSCIIGTYYEMNINTCSDCDLNCAQCNNFTYCEKCKQKYFLNTSINTCFNCYTGCLTCANSSNNACYSCQQFFKLNYNQCIEYSSCTQGKIQVNNVCIDCSPGCQICLSQTQCKICKNLYLMINSSCIYCNNVLGMYIQNEICIQICGDGYRFYQQCDDGNNQNNDGCNSQCKIQNGYICEGNRFNPDICWKKDDIVFPLIPQVKRSLISNQVMISIVSRPNLLPKINNAIVSFPNLSIGYNVSLIYQNRIPGIIISYNQNILNAQCNIFITQTLNFSFLIQTFPKSYHYESSDFNKCQLITKIVKYLSISSLFIILSTQLISNQFSNTIFLQTIQIYILSLFNYRYISPIVYNCILELKYFVLLLNIDMNSLFNQRFTQKYIFGIVPNNFAYLATNIFILYIIIGFCMLLLAFSFLFINKKIKKLYQKNIKEYKVFLYHTFCMYQPLLLFNFLNNITNSIQTVSIILGVLTGIFFLMSIIFFIYHSIRKNNKLVKSRGLQKARNYIFIFTLWISKSNCYSVYPLILLCIFSLCKICFQKSKPVLQFKNRLIKYQQIYNDVFLLLNSIFISINFMLFSQQYDYKMQLLLGWLNVLNVVLCIALNSCILLSLFINRIYQIYYRKKPPPPIQKKISSSSTTFDFVDAKIGNQPTNSTKQQSQSVKGLEAKNEYSLYNISFYPD